MHTKGFALACWGAAAAVLLACASPVWAEPLTWTHSFTVTQGEPMSGVPAFEVTAADSGEVDFTPNSWMWVPLANLRGANDGPSHTAFTATLTVTEDTGGVFQHTFAGTFDVTENEEGGFNYSHTLDPLADGLTQNAYTVGDLSDFVGFWGFNPDEEGQEGWGGTLYALLEVGEPTDEVPPPPYVLFNTGPPGGVQTTPEPGSLILAGLGLAGLGVYSVRKRLGFAPRA